jgi:hypothetical protein
MRTHASIDGGRAEDPAEGRTDLDLPGADRGHPTDVPPPDAPAGEGAPGLGGEAPHSPEADRRDELAHRVGSAGPSPAGRDRPDVLPDVELPDEQA